MISRRGRTMLVAALLVLGPAAAAAQWWPGSGPPPPDVQYVMDDQGKYTGEKRTIYGDDVRGRRYACRGGTQCVPCGDCHRPAAAPAGTRIPEVAQPAPGAQQGRGPAYGVRFDVDKHEQVYFPKLEAKLQENQALPWGKNAYVAYRAGEVIVSSKDRQELVAFPRGSKIVLNPAGQAVFIAILGQGEPRVPPRR
jgi:hypothetical protein